MAKSSSRGSLTSMVAVGLIGAGIYLGMQFKSPGPGGSGDDAGIQTSSSTVVTSAESRPTEPMPELPEQPPEPAFEPVESPEMISVLIREDGFVVERSDISGGEAMALPELADLAATTTGTETGIRVRVLRHTTARAGDQQRLYQALTGAGIKPEAMQQMSGFVE